ncbi:MAG: hypothetical protein SPE30_02225 [Candidatus Treponema excrementipullorum]|nr:hypothetical protein [Spirochaetia bacterium]MDD7012721.1 hypothetical protein [Candidatus Treponema excrementipullorum]MDY4465096.1 hypothetical protein [Candidatus Treponema excrementipullorum]
MKRILTGAILLITACTTAVSQVSLLNESTNGLFRNVNDFVIKPNVMFNTVETKQVIIGSGFNDLTFKSNTNGGGLIGYYHPGKLPWSVAAALDMKSENHNVESVTKTNGTTTTTTEHKNPAFDTYQGGLRFTIGFPDIMNLSAGIVAHFEGKSQNEAETTKTERDTTTTTITEQTKELDIILGVPVSIQFTPTIHNFFEPYIFISQDKRIVGGDTATNADAGSESKTTAVEFALYDKFTMQNLFPAPFGAETSFWLGLGVGKGAGEGTLVAVEEIEKPAYDSVDFESIGYEVKVATQIGMSNLLDFSVGTIQLRVKPMTYFDFLLGVHKSFTFGATVAIAAGAYAPLSDLPLALFFGVTPGLQFYNTAKYEESSTSTLKSASRALTTSAFWTGKVGISVLMPKNMAFDITLNVNQSGKSIGLSALMAVSL